MRKWIDRFNPWKDNIISAIKPAPEKIHNHWCTELLIIDTWDLCLFLIYCSHGWQCARHLPCDNRREVRRTACDLWHLPKGAQVAHEGRQNFEFWGYLEPNITKIWGAIDMSISGYTTPYWPIGVHIFLMNFSCDMTARDAQSPMWPVTISQKCAAQGVVWHMWHVTAHCYYSSQSTFSTTRKAIFESSVAPRVFPRFAQNIAQNDPIGI